MAHTDLSRAMLLIPLTWLPKTVSAGFKRCNSANAQVVRGREMLLCRHLIYNSAVYQALMSPCLNAGGQRRSSGPVWALTGGHHDTTALCARDSEFVRMSRGAFEVLAQQNPARHPTCSRAWRAASPLPRAPETRGGHFLTQPRCRQA